MRSETEKLIEEAHVLTAPRCRADRAEGRSCCTPEGCRATAAGLRAVGLPVPPAGDVPGLPFMGPAGCVLPLAHRPVCSWFVCAEHTVADPLLRASLDFRIRRILSDPEAARMVEAGAEALKGESA